MKKTTSAQMLRDHLALMRKSATAETDTVTTLWERSLDTKANSPNWYAGLEKFWRLIDLVRNDIEASTLDDDIKRDFLGHIDRVASVGQSQQMHAQWKQVGDSYLKQDAIVKLAYIHGALRHEVEQHEISEKDAKEIIELAETILLALREADLPDELLIQIRASIARIIFALQHISIFGVKGLEEAMAYFYGNTLLNQNKLYEVEKKSPGLRAKLGDLSGKMLRAVNWGVGAANTLESGGELVKQLIDAAHTIL